MPHLRCPACRVNLYSAAPVSMCGPCPRCGRRLVARSAGRREPAPAIFAARRLPSGKPPDGGLVEPQAQTATRIGHGGSLADAEREIVAPCPLGETQLAALRLYARVKLRTGRSEASPASLIQGGER